jgi:nucleoside-triphosphatase
MMQKHILLTGEMGVGKSFLIKRLQAHLTCPIKGFFTMKMAPDATGHAAVYMHSASRGASDLLAQMDSKDNQIGLCSQHGMIERYPSVFDNYGCKCLEGPNDGIWLMDELGFMELESLKFQASVLNLLNGSTPVLAVVKKRSNPFLEAVLVHPNTVLYEVTVANRDALYEELCEKVCAWF